MPRQANGTYALPLPTVVSGTTIESTWANTTMADLAQALTDSLSRTAQGNMSEPLLAVDGTKAAPGLAFVSEANSGLYRDTAGDIYMSVLGDDYMRWTDDNNVQFSNDLGATWLDIADDAEVEANADAIAVNTTKLVSALSWSGNVLTATRAAGNFTVEIDVFSRIKSDGSIRHLSALISGATPTVTPSTKTRYTLTNTGNAALTFTRPTGIDADLGEEYCVEGSVLITNNGTPGVITINNDAGAVPAANILGTQNTVPNAIMVVSYLIHRHAGDTYNEVYSWAT